MDENVLFRVVAVDESVSAFDVEPFDGTGDFGGDQLFGFLFFLFDAAVLAAGLVPVGGGGGE